jgi:methylenetetrahydrofolate dehydrogenase (NADP+)/methenyltetrahydrofolate cyclohydrolase
MTATLIEGKAIAAALRFRVAAAADALARAGARPRLAVILVGDDPASDVYVRNKITSCAAAGIGSIERRLPAATPEDEIVGLVRALNADEAVDGVLVQMPLPRHVAPARVLGEIDPAKDVDGLTAINAGRLLLGESGLRPCTPQGAIMLAKSVGRPLAGLNAVVVGRSILVGRPLALLLLEENCTVAIAHSKTRDLADLCRGADILCAALGRPQFIAGDWVKEGAIVIDVGINRIDAGGRTRLVGDVDFEAARRRAGAITPVPGGVGPMTIACLLRNTVLAAARRRGLPDPEV